MFRRFSINYIIISVVLGFGLTLVAFALAVKLRLNLESLPSLSPVGDINYLQFPLILLFVLPTLWTSIFFLASVYDPVRTNKAVDEIIRVCLACGLSTLVFSGLLYLFVQNFSRYLLIIFIALNLVFLLGRRMVARFIRRTQRKTVSDTRVLIVGAGEVGQKVESMIQESGWAGLNCVGYLDDDLAKREGDIKILCNLDSTRNIVRTYQFDDVIVALPQSAYGKVNQLAFYLHDLPVHLRVVPDYFSLFLNKASVDDFGGLPMINLIDLALNEVQRLMKRSFDLIIAGTTMIVAFPVRPWLQR